MVCDSSPAPYDAVVVVIVDENSCVFIKGVRVVGSRVPLRLVGIVMDGKLDILVLDIMVLVAMSSCPVTTPTSGSPLSFEVDDDCLPKPLPS